MNARILAGKQDMPTLPEEAIVRYKNQDYIFVKEGQTAFKIIKVETGVKEGGIVEVKSRKYTFFRNTDSNQRSQLYPGRKDEVRSS